ncbi:MAG TPA: hypothetical protein PKO06_04055, partial [Candidatus Ozemobacteraceae bacterium]|nr:hypothetical protein [Candidatus Ozemobacteraceae bacterium]
LALTRVWQWVGIGLLVAVVAPWFWGAAEGLGRWFYLVQPLWGRALVENVPTDTAFPAFPWLVYPLTGLIIGLSMRSGTTENQLRPGMTAAGSVLLVSGLIIVQIWGQTQYGDYYRMPVGGTFVYLGFALLWISSFLWLSKYGLGQKPLSALSFWSEHITLVYCVQWFLFGFSVLFLRFRTVDSLLVLVALIPVFLGLTWAISRLLLRSARFMHVFRWFSR